MGEQKQQFETHTIGETPPGAQQSPYDHLFDIRVDITEAVCIQPPSQDLKLRARHWS